MKQQKKRIHLRNHDFVKVDTKVVHEMHNIGVKSWIEIMILCKIITLSTKQVCTAQNIYFAELLDCTERYVEECISDLRKRGLISTFGEKAKVDDQGNYYTPRRYIYVLKPVSEWVKRSFPVPEGI